MPEPDFTQAVRAHLAPPAAAPRVEAADLDRSHERTSADGRVTASVDGLRLEVESVVVNSREDPDTLGRAVVEAVNDALAAAAAGPAQTDLAGAVAARVAETERQMDAISLRLDELSARLDRLIGD
ncbi:hypothetical protein GC722_10240 [Auraticoccus sp. F435]|uniref:Uncharacterized protein n=1 Tax=Auraticoccus cholistanensis TaxID=2656650 RepID=A0A6A9V0X1_9ACTN|nr:hypothetical protein [Auraticoccus cholistanensis]MVA76399.1 hypothetical protein [Auraticoccus cholistanensis]